MAPKPTTFKLEPLLFIYLPLCKETQIKELKHTLSWSFFTVPYSVASRSDVCVRPSHIREGSLPFDISCFVYIFGLFDALKWSWLLGFLLAIIKLFLRYYGKQESIMGPRKASYFSKIYSHTAFQGHHQKGLVTLWLQNSSWLPYWYCPWHELKIWRWSDLLGHGINTTLHVNHQFLH
jgi:hypothetical protein